MVVYEDGGAEPIRVFDHGVVYQDPETFGEYHLSYRTGDIALAEARDARAARAPSSRTSPAIRRGNRCSAPAWPRRGRSGYGGVAGSRPAQQVRSRSRRPTALRSDEPRLATAPAAPHQHRRRLARRDPVRPPGSSPRRASRRQSRDPAASPRRPASADASAFLRGAAPTDAAGDLLASRRVDRGGRLAGARCTLTLPVVDAAVQGLRPVRPRREAHRPRPLDDLPWCSTRARRLRSSCWLHFRLPPAPVCDSKHSALLRRRDFAVRAGRCAWRAGAHRCARWAPMPADHRRREAGRASWPAKMRAQPEYHVAPVGLLAVPRDAGALAGRRRLPCSAVTSRS